ncbi:MAG: hypothetical protein RLZZ546_2231, partial [Bacteroidota bacterium]
QSNWLLSLPHDNPNQSIDYIKDTKIRFQVFPNIENGVYYWTSEAQYVPVPGVLNVKIIDEFTPPSGFKFHGRACDIGEDCDHLFMWGWQSSERQLVIY